MAQNLPVSTQYTSNCPNDTDSQFGELLEEAYQYLSSSEDCGFHNDPSCGTHQPSPPGASSTLVEASVGDVGVSPQPRFKTSAKCSHL